MAVRVGGFRSEAHGVAERQQGVHSRRHGDGAHDLGHCHRRSPGGRGRHRGDRCTPVRRRRHLPGGGGGGSTPASPQHTTGGKPRLGRISKMGTARPETPPGHGSHGGRPARGAARRDHGSVAGRDVGTQAEEGGRGGARQQDGTEGLGAEDEKGDLPDSCCCLTERRKERSERQRSHRAPGRTKRGKGKRSTRRGRKTSKWRRAWSPLSRFGSDLTNTIRARSQQGLHQRPDIRQYLTRLPPDSDLNPGLPTWGRPHTSPCTDLSATQGPKWRTNVSPLPLVSYRSRNVLFRTMFGRERTANLVRERSASPTSPASNLAVTPFSRSTPSKQ